MGTDRAAVVLAMEPGRDRRLLREWLGSKGGRDVAGLDPGDPLPEEYDLCVLDRAGFDRRREAIRRRREAADPVFLPHVLVVPGDETDEDRALEAADGLVDEVVTLPVGKTTLGRRVGNLLRTRRAAVELRQREEQYRQLVERTPESLLIVRDGRVVYANDAAADVFGAGDPAALADRPAADLVTEPDRASLEEVLRTIGAEGRLDAFRELEMCSVEDEPVTAQLAGVVVTFEGERAVQLLVRDVTAERERQQRLDLFGRAIETATQGITIADARQDDEPLVYANAAFERITGYSTAEIMGRNCRFLQGENTDGATVDEVRRAIDAERPVAVELLNYRKDGTPFWNELRIVPVADEEGQVTHYLGLQRDVSERKEREERLSVLDRVLRHNIRNRMNVVRGNAEHLRGRLPEGEAEPVGRIVDAADELIRISEQVKQFQSVVSGRERPLRRQDLGAVAERVVAGLSADHEGFEVEATAARARVHETFPAAVEELLELAVRNGGGSLDVTLRVTAEAEWVTVAVVDREGAIPEDDLVAIARERETPLEHARGLELWLLRWAVLYSDGELTVEEGPPTTIRMRFPRAEAG